MTEITTTAQAVTPTTIEPEKESVSLPATNGRNVMAGFSDSDGFALAQRIATAFSRSTLVPDIYRNNMPNCLIALNMAQRLRADQLMVMQNLYVVHGRPAWSSTFLIACFNQCGRFSSMRFEWRGKQGQKEWGCRAFATEKATGDRIDGAWITWQMAEAEGWPQRKGSKWVTMPQQMFMYRAASFFVRAYAPELSMGLYTQEELHDVVDVETVRVAPTDLPKTLADLKSAPDPEPDPEPEPETEPEPIAFDREKALDEIRAIAEINEKAMSEVEGACAEADAKAVSGLTDEQIENLRLKVAAMK